MPWGERSGGLGKRARHVVAAWLLLASPAFAARLGPDGEVGKMGALGPFPSSKGVERTFSLGQLDTRSWDGSRPQGAMAARYRVLGARAGALDLKPITHAAKSVLLVGGRLEVSQAGDYVLIARGGGGLRLCVDGQELAVLPAPRSASALGEAYTVHLEPGSHTVSAVLDKPSAPGLRVLGADFRPSSGLRWQVDGEPDSGDTWTTTLTGQFEGDRVRLDLEVRSPSTEDAAADEPLEVEVLRGERSLFRLPLGRMPLPAAHMTVRLPSLRGEEAEGAMLRVRTRWGRRVQESRLTLASGVRAGVAAAREAMRQPQAIAAARPGSLESVENLANVVEAMTFAEEPDPGARAAMLAELAELTAALRAQRDPYAGRSGPQRRAFRSPVDGALHEFGLYVPRQAAEGEKKLPLSFVLHGLNGRPMTMLRYFFGGDVAGKAALWKDRHWDAALPAHDGLVVAPSGYGNAMYRWMAEDEVLHLLAWARSVYRVDDDRVSITGASMGGIGAAAIPLHHPGIFSAAAPLCGYHDYFLRSDVARWRRTPWERFLGEERSNVRWAENGHDLPMYIVHGTRDLPVANSGVLIERYQKLGYSMRHEHPELGHNVWQKTYENLQGARWLTAQRRSQPKRLHFRSVRPRYGQSSWLRFDAQEQSGEWSELRAQLEPDAVTVSTVNVRALQVDRAQAKLGERAVQLRLDGQTLDYAADEPLRAHRGTAGDPRSWRKGALPAGQKSGALTGPFRDLYHQPLVFVIGTADPRFTAVNREVTANLARVKNGVVVQYPIVTDDEVLRSPARIAPGSSVVLVGPAGSNRLRARYDATLPSHVVDEDGAPRLRFGSHRFEGPHVGVAYVVPHPDDAGAYLAVVEATDPLGLRTALALPELLPDFVVFDRQLLPARGGILLGAGKVLAGGYFDAAWQVPSKL